MWLQSPLRLSDYYSKINFRQNTAYPTLETKHETWKVTHDLSANHMCAPGEHGTLAWIAGAVLLGMALIWFV